MEKYKYTYAQWLNNTLEVLGVTAATVARGAGVSGVTLSRLRHGRVTCSDQTSMDIYRAVMALSDGKVEIPPPPPKPDRPEQESVNEKFAPVIPFIVLVKEIGADNARKLLEVAIKMVELEKELTALVGGAP